MAEIDIYGPEWLAIVADFTRPGVPPEETWAKLASYNAQCGNSDSAAWCSMVAGGRSQGEADLIVQHMQR